MKNRYYKNGLKWIMILLMLLLSGVFMAAYPARVSASSAKTYTSKDGKWRFEIINENSKTARLCAYVAKAKATKITLPASVTAQNGKTYKVTEAGCVYHGRYADGEDEDGNVRYVSIFPAENSSTLTSVTIPKSVQKIADGAFYEQTKLQSVTFEKGSQCRLIDYEAFCGDISLKSITIPASVTRIEDEAFADTYKMTNITFSQGSRLTYIGVDAFGASGIKSITLPSTLATIEADAFQDTDITSITIPASVTSLGEFAFWGCNNLKTVKFAANSKCTSIGMGAFMDCENLTSLSIPAKVATIPEGFINGCSSLKKFIIPNTVKMIDSYAFNGCKGTTVTFAGGSRCTTIGDYAFSGVTDWNCDVNEYTAITEIEGNGGASIGSFTLPASVTTLGEGVFAGNESITGFSLASGSKVTTLPSKTFCDCTSLKSITIPAQITKLGNNILAKCTGLETIGFASGTKVTTLPSYFAYGCKKLRSITLPAGVMSIGDMAFSNCTALASVGFSSGTKCSSIGKSAFAGCTGLKNIKLPKSVGTISDRAFLACANLNYVDIAADSIKVGKNAFATIAYSADEGAGWAGWKPAGSMNGSIYVNNAAVKKSLVDNESLKSGNVIIRNYTVELYMKDGGGSWYRKTGKTFAYGTEFTIQSFFTDARDGYIYTWNTREDGKGTSYSMDSKLKGLTKDGLIKLYGTVTLRRYDVIYDVNGGRGSVTGQEDVAYNEHIRLRRSPGLSKSGYVCTGWNTKPDGSGTAYEFDQYVSGLTKSSSIILYAQWTEAAVADMYIYKDEIKNGRFTVWASMREEGVMGRQFKIPTYESVSPLRNYYTYTYISPDNIPQTITRDMAEISTLTGWRIYSAGERPAYIMYPEIAVKNDCDIGEKITLDRSVDMVPNVVYRDLTISFDGGSSTGSMENVVCSKGKLDAGSLACGFTKAGYEFGGWTVRQLISGDKEDVLISDKDIDDGGSIDGEILYSLYMFSDSDCHVVLKPVWSKTDTYKVQFQAGGGKGTMKSIICADGRNKKLPACTFTKKGSVFQGWALTGSDKVVYKDGDVINRKASDGDIRLRAVWANVPYTVVYNGNGGEGYMDDVEVASGEIHTIQENEYIKPGAEFLRWNTAEDGSGDSYEAGAELDYSPEAKNEKVELYAVWKTHSITLKFNANGGTTGKVSKTVLYGESCGALPVPKRSGYVFMGWYTRKNGGRQYTSTTKMEIDSNVTLYARWEAQQYTVTFDVNGGGAATMTSKSVKSGKCIGALPKTVKDGYSFEGWYTSRSGGSKVSTLYKVYDNVTFYAHWKEITRKVEVSIALSSVSGTVGYEMQYAQSSGFGGAVTLSDTVTYAGKYTRLVSGLKPDTTYYFRARSYALKNGQKVYSAWSRVLSLKTSK